MEQPRLNLTIPAAKTQPMERSLFSTTPPATATPPTGRPLSISTPPATTTRPTVLQRSLATPPAEPTRLWALARETALPRLIPSPVSASNTTWIASVYGVTTQSGTTAPVIVSDTGQLGTLVSSERFKKDIATMENASETILSLRPVTFHYKTDTKGTPQFGLIAEEVAKVNSALVLPDKEGKPYTVRYDAVNAMLLNEFLKEHRKVEAQERRLGGQEVTITELKLTIAQQQKAMETVTAQLKEQAAQIQKVSAQLEASRPAPQMVLNNP